MDQETSTQLDIESSNTESTFNTFMDALWKNLTSWVIATLVLLVLLGGVAIAPILVTGYEVSKEPQNTTLWGWMYMWTEFRDPQTFTPLVCDGSQARELTDDYLAALSEIPFEFVNVEAEKIGENRARAKALLECTFADQDGTETVTSNWEADFITKITPPVGLCIAEIRVRTGADLCR